MTTKSQENVVNDYSRVSARLGILLPWYHASQLSPGIKQNNPPRLRERNNATQKRWVVETRTSAEKLVTIQLNDRMRLLAEH
ncbi:hypothetical protein CHS0354_039093 [Potamilus streckersoni]|uniref:Uncharacterized protein n=1 Tax=Potamilus streckersoni TaxID=2493646 RepID=A0AAE0TJA6_9BIVA|nr:hypothetical protein CHS0354_039093 [Potamilus streckersoni]